MKEAMAKVNTKLKTKGRFQVEIPTNGLLNRTDMLWAQKANPGAHAAHVHREQLDIKMLQKKKKSREMSSNLWMQKGATRKQSSKALKQNVSAASNVRSSLQSDVSGKEKEAKNVKEVIASGSKSFKSVGFAS